MKTIGSASTARPQNGFTMIELLIVIVILGILAGIGLPHFSKTKEKAYLAAMKTDLRNLVTAQEIYFADNMNYTTDKSIATGINYSESSAVTVAIALTAGPPAGYNGIATHTGTAETCVIFMNGAAVPPATGEGQATCTN